LRVRAILWCIINGEHKNMFITDNCKTFVIVHWIWFCFLCLLGQCNDSRVNLGWKLTWFGKKGNVVHHTFQRCLRNIKHQSRQIGDKKMFKIQFSKRKFQKSISLKLFIDQFQLFNVKKIWKLHLSARDFRSYP
jgi:hypothetical protein